MHQSIRTVVGSFRERLRGQSRDDAALRAGLLRELAALSLPEIALRLDGAVSTAHQRVRAHERRCEIDDGYRRAVARIVDLVVRRSVPAPARGPLAGVTDAFAAENAARRGTRRAVRSGCRKYVAGFGTPRYSA